MGVSVLVVWQGVSPTTILLMHLENVVRCRFLFGVVMEVVSAGRLFGSGLRLLDLSLYLVEPPPRVPPSVSFLFLFLLLKAAVLRFDDAIVVCGVTSLDFNNNVDFAEVDCLVLFLGLLTGVVE